MMSRGFTPARRHLAASRRIYTTTHANARAEFRCNDCLAEGERAQWLAGP